MSNIYDQHRAAFSNVSAFVVTDKDGERVASIAFKYPRDGIGRLYCYLHVFGVSMVRGFAAGCGYDKHSAAIHAAVRRVSDDAYPDAQATVKAFKAAIQDGGHGWQRELEAAGFKVMQAV